jgi:hypothetical protein
MPMTSRLPKLLTSSGQARRCDGMLLAPKTSPAREATHPPRPGLTRRGFFFGEREDYITCATGAPPARMTSAPYSTWSEIRDS